MKTDDFRVYLRAFELEDYKTTVIWHRDDEIWNMSGSTKYIVSSEYEKKWVYDAIWDKDKIIFGICLKDSNELIGFVGITDLDWVNRSAYCIETIGAKEHWRKGLATEALLLLLNFAFRERGFNRIWGRVSETNVAARRNLEKCGFKNEGVLRSVYFRDGKYHDFVLISILNNEFDVLLREKGLE